ncbi:CAAX prenyl protease 2 isoform X2 [Arachis stenosperma]|uniref:CAAX prenyl protease 2 isoform X2 n=1 Tax=Arachis stenosperma TaxID=217475 RepID=UPI0025AB8578|nr:CAAX prenyl protease 2 isoform X2 [Arachis stenosperma]
MPFSPSPESQSLGLLFQLQKRHPAMEPDGVVSKPFAVVACVSMALLYVAVLYAPTLLLRLPPPSSFEAYMIRRFLCAVVSTVISLSLSALIIPVQSKELLYLFGVYGIRMDHIWQAVVFPLTLTSLMYAGSLFLKFLLLLGSWREHTNSGGGLSFDSCKYATRKFVAWFSAVSTNVMAWRNYIVAPLTEELVFRACMIPMLLCGGFKPYGVILLCPIFFSLAHLNHFMEIYAKQNYRIKKAVMVIGLQLGYTVVFGSYASFLFIRTGHLIAPLVAHICCNFMGLPVLFSKRSAASIAFILGLLGFLWLLFPITTPDLYNDRVDNCSCWQGYCSWRVRNSSSM